MVEDSLGLVVWVILGTQHPKPALELINVESKILSLRMRNVNRLIRHYYNVWYYIELSDSSIEFDGSSSMKHSVVIHCQYIPWFELVANLDSTK